MNMIVWWFVLMISSWVIVALIIWKTSLVFSGEEGALGEESTSDEERRVENG